MDATPLAMYNYFIDRVKQNLHIVLAMSPIGDAFRNRLRMFPSLINCCTIDWFQVSAHTDSKDAVRYDGCPDFKIQCIKVFTSKELWETLFS
jgi:dynein heavy chain